MSVTQNLLQQFTIIDAQFVVVFEVRTKDILHIYCSLSLKLKPFISYGSYKTPNLESRVYITQIPVLLYALILFLFEQ